MKDSKQEPDTGIVSQYQFSTWRYFLVSYTEYSDTDDDTFMCHL